MKYLKILLTLFFTFLFINTCYAEGQGAITVFLTFVFVIFGVMIWVFGGIILRGLCWLFKLKMADSTCFIVSGAAGIGFLTVSLLSSEII